MDEFVTRLLADPAMLRMGHAQRADDRNLGLGWLYYGFARLVRHPRAVVIGSWRGFVPAIIGRALADNVEQGEVLFIDPALVDDFWHEPARVAAYFAGLGAPNVRHVRQTTQEFAASPEHAALGEVGLLVVDGFHSAEQARFDYLSFLPKLSADAIVLFHDSVRRMDSPIYGKDRVYEHTVCLFMDRLRETPGLEVLSLPFAGGLSIVRGKPLSRERIDAPF